MEAEDILHGGVLIVSQASGISRKTIIKEKKDYREFENNAKLSGSENVMPVERIKKEGAGRKDLKEQNPKLLKTLDLHNPAELVTFIFLQLLSCLTAIVM